MRKTIRKLFLTWDFEGEENWINGMAKQGWHLVEVSFTKYTFERGEPDRYRYCLELFREAPDSHWGKEYIHLYKEAGIVQVGYRDKWVYWRMEKGKELPDLFTDLDSKIVYLKRLLKFTAFPTGIVLFSGIVNLWFNLPSGATETDWGGLILSVVLLILGGMGLFESRKIHKKIRVLERARILHE